MKELLSRCNVIRTNPLPGYWGIAVVLSQCEETSEFEPMCHIALTPSVFQHEVEFRELSSEDLKVLEIENWNFNPLGSNIHSDKVIGVYSRITNAPLSIIGSVDPTLLYEGPLPFSPDYGLDVTWPLCGSVSEALGMEAITRWLRKNDPNTLEGLFSKKDTAAQAKEQSEIPVDELWVMLKMDQNFRSVDELVIEDGLIDLIESAGLGEFDGHSSGAHQFDLNFFDVANFEKAKNKISKFLTNHYPDLEYEISKTYETTFDKK